MNRRYNYSRLSPPTVERFSCSCNQGAPESGLGPGLIPGIPSDLLTRHQPERTETISMPLYYAQEDAEEVPVTADKLKPSKGCCGNGGI